MRKQKTLIVAGKELPVLIETGWFPEFYFEATGVDIVEAGGVGKVYQGNRKMYRIVAGLLYAGYLTYCKITKKQWSLTYEECCELVLSLPTELEVIDIYMEILALDYGMTREELAKKMAPEDSDVEKKPKAQASKKKAA